MPKGHTPPGLGEKPPLEKVVSEYTDDDLRTEIARRGQERQAKKESRHRKVADRFEAIVCSSDSAPRDIFDVLCPEHQKGEACSDSSPYNDSFNTLESTPVCMRCVLMSLMRGNTHLPYPVLPKLTFERKFFEDDEPT